MTTKTEVKTLVFDYFTFAKAIARRRSQHPRTVTVKMRGRTTTKTEPMSLRTCAAEIGISAATLNRIERGMDPDINTFGKVCAWLCMPPNKFFNTVSKDA